MSVVADILLAAPGEKNYMTVLIIGVLVAVSGTPRFVQEGRSARVAEQLSAMIHTTACVERGGVRQEVIEKQRALGAEALASDYEKADELPFDFERRRMSDMMLFATVCGGPVDSVARSPCRCCGSTSLNWIVNRPGCFCPASGVSFAGQAGTVDDLVPLGIGVNLLRTPLARGVPDEYNIQIVTINGVPPAIWG